MQRLTQAMGCLQGKHFTKCRETFCDKSAHHVRAAICQRYTSSRSTDMIFPIYYLAPWKYIRIYISSGTLPTFPLEIWSLNHPLVLCQYDQNWWPKTGRVQDWGTNVQWPTNGYPGQNPNNGYESKPVSVPISVPDFFHWFNGCLFPQSLVINIIISGKRLHNYGKSPCY